MSRLSAPITPFMCLTASASSQIESKIVDSVGLINLTIPNSIERCTLEEFWGCVADYLCTASVGQPYVNTIIAVDPACTPIARHYASYCGRANSRYFLDILQDLFLLVNPTQPAFANPYLKNVTSECANYSWFASDMCSAPCKKGSPEKIENINDVDGPISSTSIHGAVVTLSPVKKGRLFDGLLADKTSQIQLVSFRECSNESWTIIIKRT